MQIKYKNSIVDINRIGSRYLKDEYRVTLIEGIWPTNDELIELAEKNNPFGGRVEWIDSLNNIKRIYVYND